MHEAKYQIPRDPDLRAAYRSSKFQRPKLKIHAAWAFGHVLRVAILEERTFHGSSMVRELLSLVLEDVMVECGRAGRPLPHTCVVVGDNTVKGWKTRQISFMQHSWCKTIVWSYLVCQCSVFTFYTCIFFLNGMIVLIFLILYFWFSKKLIDQRYMAMMMMRVSHTHDVIGSFLCFRHSFSFCFCCLQIHFGSSSIWKLLAYELHFK